MRAIKIKWKEPQGRPTEENIPRGIAEDKVAKYLEEEYGSECLGFEHGWLLCEHCIEAIESHEGKMYVGKMLSQDIDYDEEKGEWFSEYDEPIYECDWCKEPCPELYECL